VAPVGDSRFGEEYPISYPAAYPEVVAVAATTIADEHASYSATGSEVEVAAPGGGASANQIISTWPRDIPCTGSPPDYCSHSSTGGAATLVAGGAAFVWSIVPQLSSDEVRQILLDTAAPLAESEDKIGRGLLDLEKAVDHVLSIPYLTLELTDHADPIPVGSQITYTIAVANHGFASAHNVILTSTLPVSVTFASVTPSEGSCSRASRHVVCDLGKMDRGDAASVIIVVAADTGETLVRVTHTAQVTSDIAGIGGSSSGREETIVFGPGVSFSYLPEVSR
jgi:uncharacterized repeat protein (TIGR01451 family)